MNKLLTTLVLFCAVAALAAPVRAQVIGPVLIGPEPTRVMGEGETQADPHLSGSMIVFADENHTAQTSIIRYQDLGTAGFVGHVTPLENTIDIEPDVFGSKIVFTRRNMVTNTYAAMLFDIANPTAGAVEISPAANVRRTQAALGGDTIAFRQSAGTSVEGVICVASVANPLAAARCFTSPFAYNQHPAVAADGNVVAWQSCMSSEAECTLYSMWRDPATGVWSHYLTMELYGGDILPPAADDLFLTWTLRSAEGESDIAYFSNPLLGGAGEVLNLRLSGSNEINANVAGGLISFERAMAGEQNADIYIHQVSTNTLFQLTNTPGINEAFSDISINPAGQVWVAWLEHDGLSNKVWTATFTLSSPPEETPPHTVQTTFNQTHSYKVGSVVPIRLQLLDDTGANISSPSLTLTATGLVQKDSSSSPVLIESPGNSNPDSAFRYDVTLQGYAFNLSTKNLAAGTWELRFTVSGDAREYSVTFDLR